MGYSQFACAIKRVFGRYVGESLVPMEVRRQTLTELQAQGCDGQEEPCHLPCCRPISASRSIGQEDQPWRTQTTHKCRTGHDWP